ncbi:MAG TPA: ABC transporter ATP-binding protein [Syntrophaceticus sp.]|nr:ABC transporter ATP-binding protein [Syntrophaceticus sp.]
MLNDISLYLNAGETLGIVGESGSGKSTLLRHIACLDKLNSGSIFLRGQDYTGAKPRQICRDIQMVFQDAVASFDPRMTIRRSLCETLRLRDGKDNTDAQIKLLMSYVGLPEELLDRYPHQLSGGQCQRMALARAISIVPAILLCDEITSALDVSAQAQIVRLLAKLRTKLDLAIIFVSHDLALVSGLCDRIMVFHEGKCVEEGTARQIISTPQAEYTQRLLSSVLTV